MGEPLAWATSYKVRTWPGSVRAVLGDHLRADSGVSPSNCRSSGEALGFHGALSIDLIVDERSRAAGGHRGQRRGRPAS